MRIPFVASTLLALILNFSDCLAGKMALVIGINNYAQNPDNRYKNLQGAVNDARFFRAMLIDLYRFDSSNIVFLSDKEASRARILSELENLALKAGKNDQIVFYYSGHGSQVPNPAADPAEEPDGMDETLVPADVPEGKAEITDKEQNRIFVKILEKGAWFTVVYDCCHSGSGSRGPVSTKAFNERKISPSDIPVPDNYKSVSLAEKYPRALILSACTDRETAKEWSSEALNDQTFPGYRGAFTHSLQVELAQNPQMAVLNLMNSVSAIIFSLDFGRQNPTLETGDWRKYRNIIGDSINGVYSMEIPVTLMGNDDSLQLGTGSLFGFSNGTRLQGIADSSLLIEITEVLGINASKAKIIANKGGVVTPGTRLKVKSIVYDDAYNFPVSIERNKAFTLKSFQTLAPLSARISSLKNFVPMEDLSEAELTVHFRNKDWEVSDRKGLQKFQSSNAEKVISYLEGNSTFRWFIPIPWEVYEQMNMLHKGQSGSVQEVELEDKKSVPVYHLAASFRNELVDMAWLKTNVNSRFNKSPLSNYKKIHCFNPLQESGWIATFLKKANLSAQKLNKIYSLLRLNNPLARESKFPYKLVLRQEGNNQQIQHQDSIKQGQPFGIYLEKSDRNIDNNQIKPRFIYLYYIDEFGCMQKLFPQAGEGFQFPPKNSEAFAFPLFRSSGFVSTNRNSFPEAESFFFFSTQSPGGLPDLSDDSEGEDCQRSAESIQMGKKGAGAPSALFQFFDRFGTGVKARCSIDGNWSIDRLIVISSP